MPQATIAANAQSIDPETLSNICSTLGCAPQDVTEFSPIDEGLTNDSFRFVAAGKPYV